MRKKLDLDSEDLNSSSGFATNLLHNAGKSPDFFKFVSSCVKWGGQMNLNIDLEWQVSVYSPLGLQGRTEGVVYACHLSTMSCMDLRWLII